MLFLLENLFVTVVSTILTLVFWMATEPDSPTYIHGFLVTTTFLGCWTLSLFYTSCWRSPANEESSEDTNVINWTGPCLIMACIFMLFCLLASKQVNLHVTFVLVFLWLSNMELCSTAWLRYRQQRDLEAPMEQV